MNSKIGRIVRLITMLVSVPTIALADVRYTVADLGALPGDTASQPTGINDLGQVTGYSTGSQYGTAWLYSNGTLTPLGSLGAPGSLAFAVNNSGQIVGQATTPAHDGGHGFIYANGAMQDIGAGLTPKGINDSGTIAGYYYLPAAVQRAFIYKNGSFQDLGTLPGGSSAAAYAINNAGQIAGASDVGGSSHGFLYDNGVMHDLGTLGGINSGGLAINSLGHVAGVSQTSAGEEHAFLYTPGGMVDLGTLVGGLNFNSYASGINDLDQVVGYGDSTSGERALLYSGGTLYNLNDLIDPSSGVVLARAVGINDAGQIIAWGDLGQLHSPTNTQAFLLTPTTPEPGPCVLVVAIACGLLLRRRHDLSNRAPQIS